MGNRVNPPRQLQLPPEVASNPQLKRAFDDRDFILFQLWKRSGAGNDDIEDLIQSILKVRLETARNTSLIGSIDLKNFDIIDVVGNVTTGPDQILICKNPSSINVALDPNAIKNDEVHIKRSGAVVEVIGQVDGLTNLTINVALFSLHLVFNGIDWSQI